MADIARIAEVSVGYSCIWVTLWDLSECQREFGYVLGIVCLNRVTPNFILKLLIC